MLSFAALPGGGGYRQGRVRTRPRHRRGRLTASIAELTARYAQPGRIDWIGLRPARREAVRAVPAADLTQAGLSGDHARAGMRALTLIQAEHLPVIAALCDLPEIAPERLRRNLVVSGLNLAAFKGARLRLGGAEIMLTGPCHPCSRMEEALGHGGYSAMRGHGGWYAEITAPGSIVLGDDVVPMP